MDNIRYWRLIRGQNKRPLTKVILPLFFNFDSGQILGGVKNARIKVKTRMKSVSGVQIPEFDLEVEGADGMPRYFRWIVYFFAISPVR